MLGFRFDVLLIIVLLTVSCKEKPRQANVPLQIISNAEAAEQKDTLPDFYDTSEVHTALTALPQPRVDADFHSRASSYEPFWYKYLLANFDTVAPKTNTTRASNRICKFDQEFESGIRYYHDFCASTHDQLSIFFPGASPDDIIDLYEQVRALTGDSTLKMEFDWMADSTCFFAQSDSSHANSVEVKVIPESAGCQLEISTSVKKGVPIN